MSAGEHLRGGAEGRTQAALRARQEPLLTVLRRELQERGYIEVEASEHGGGVWRAPDSTDHLLPMILDCLEREAP